MRSDILIPTVLLNKSHVKPCVMGYKHCIPDKFKKLRKNRFDIRIFQYHLIGDAGQLGNLKRNRAFRIYKCTERINNLSLYHFDSANLDNLVFDRAKSRCLQIKHYIRVIQRLFSRSDRNLCQVIYYIPFHSIQNLKRIVFVQTFDVMVRIRECLCNSMIGNCNRRMSPIVCTADNVLRLGYAVHIAHLCMAMQFHPFYRAQVLPSGREISDFFDSGHRTDGQLPVIFINGGDSLYLQISTFFQIAKQLRQLVIPRKHFHHNGVCKIGHRKHQD